MDIHTTTVGETVAQNYRAADVFKRHGIDFCCGGKRPIAEVCRQKNIDSQLIEKELSDILSVPKEDTNNYQEWSLTELSNYIIGKHHKYVEENTPLIHQYISKVARVHGHHNTETVEIAELFDEVASELLMHMKKEEQILFPYIQQLEQNIEKEGMPPFGTVKNPIRMMEHEHDLAGNIMGRIRELSNNFTPPEHACNTYRVSYAKFEEFEADLHLHVHLENNILFPRAIILEDKK